MPMDETRDFYLALSSSTHGLFSFSPSRFESNLNCLYKKEKFIRITKYYFIDRFKRKKNQNGSLFFQFYLLFFPLDSFKTPSTFSKSRARISSLPSSVECTNYYQFCEKFEPLLVVLSHSFFLFLFLSLLVDLDEVNRDQAIESFISGFGENKWCSRRFYTKLVFEFSRNFLEISVKSE